MWDFILKYWLEFVFGLIVAGLSAAYAQLAKKLKAERMKNQAIENGLKGILRIQILDTYDKCIADGKKISVSRKDAIVSIYQSYVALGDHVDDTIKQLYEELIHMNIG
jgi:DNA invertase Pin-like site-specific DNA recombinase